MARQKNEEARAALANAAYKLFIENGYNESRYEDIAAATGCMKTNVQYYYPKKETMLIDFLHDALYHSNNAVDILRIGSDDPQINNFIVAQVFFAFLLMNDDMRRLTLEALSSRSITDGLLASNEEWSLSTLNMDEANTSLISEMHLFTVGGVYDYLYRQLSNGIIPDSFFLAYRPMTIFWVFVYGHEKEQSNELLLSLRVKQEDLDKATNFILDKFLQT